jgi:antirestriction protein
MPISTIAPRVYVGTYAKYNSGSLAGKWFDLTDYSSKEEFEAACQEFHGPGEHEFMFQDHEGIPGRFISESHLDDGTWDDWLPLSDDDKELLETYLDHVNAGGTMDEARESLCGKYASKEHWAEEHLSESCLLQAVPKELQGYIDFAAYARDQELNGGCTFVETADEVWVFAE